jgi:hypothetical protein
MTTAGGRRVHLLERRNPVPYARVVSAAIPLPDQQAIAVLADPRRPDVLDRLVLLDPEGALPGDSVTDLPEPLPSVATVSAWTPGSMRVSLEPTPTAPAWLLVAENWYPGWTARVDGQETPVVRGNMTLITVPLRAGAREVELRFASPQYRTGRAVTVLSLVLVLAAFVAPLGLGRRRG